MENRERLTRTIRVNRSRFARVTAYDADRVLDSAEATPGQRPAPARLRGRHRAGASPSVSPAVYSLLRIIERLTRPQPLGQQSSSLNTSVTPDRPWLDLTYQLVNIAFALVPVLLALYLLDRTNRPAGRAIGFDLRRPAFDAWFGVVIAACIGIPGLGLYLGARALGLNTDVQASGLGRQLVDHSGPGAVRRPERRAGGGDHDRLLVHPAAPAELADRRRDRLLAR